MSNVLTLLSGHRYVELTELFLRQFLNNSETPIDGIRIFSDGSLSEQDRLSIGQLSSCIEFTDEATVEKNTLDRLAEYPNCLKLLRHYPQIRKLFHIPINSLEKRLVFMDLDILLIRPSNLDVLWREKDTFIFMQDCIRHAYCMPPTELFIARIKNGRKIHRQLNSGIISANPEHYDFQLIDRLIEEFDERIFASTMWIEQSLQSMHAYGKNVKYVNPAQLFIPDMERNPSIDSGLSALHFTAALNPLRKKQIEQVLQNQQISSSNECIEWELVNAEPYPYANNFLRDTLYRKGRNLSVFLDM